MQLSKFRLEKIKLSDNIDKINIDNLSKEDKAMYNMVYQALDKYEKVWARNDPKRVQQFAYLLVSGIKNNVESFYSDDSTKKAFKKALTEKLSEELKLASINGKNLFTKSDVEKIIEESFSLIEKDDFIQKYLGILTKQEVKKKINTFVKELNKSGGTSETNFQHSILQHSKSLESLGKATKNLAVKANIAKSIQDKISKQIDDLKKQSDISTKPQNKPSSQSSKPADNSSSGSNSSNKTEGIPFLAGILTLGGLGAIAKKISIFSKFKGKNGLATDSEHGISKFFKKTKANISLHFFSFKKQVFNRANKIKNSLSGFAKKIGKGALELGKFSVKALGLLLVAPFYFIGKGIGALFKKDENGRIPFMKALRAIFKSPTFMFTLGFFIGYIHKLIMKFLTPAKDWIISFYNGVLKFVDWVKDFALNAIDNVKKFWTWITTEVDWGKLWDKIKDVLNLQPFLDKIKSIFESIQRFFNNPIVHSVLHLVDSLGELFEYLKSTPIGQKVMQVVGIIARSSKDMFATFLSVGIGMAIAAVSTGFAKMFKGWHKKDEEDYSRDAYDLSDEYKKDLGVGLTSIGEKLQMQYKGQKPETIKATEDIIAESVSVGGTINSLLGDEKTVGTLAWFARGLLKTKKRTFRDLETDKLNDIFYFGFLTENPRIREKLNKYSMDLKNYFMTSDSLNKVGAQQNFLEYVTRLKNELLETNAFFMQRLKLADFHALLNDIEYFDTPADESLWGIFHLLDMKNWGRDDWNMKNPKADLDEMIHIMRPRLHTLRQFMLEKYAKKYDKPEKNYKIPITLDKEFFGVQYKLKRESALKYRPFTKSKELFKILFDTPDDIKKTYYSNASMFLFDNPTPYNLGLKFTDEVVLDRRNAYDRMIDAISIKTDNLKEALQNGYDYLESQDWQTIKFLLSDGESLSKTKTRINSEAEQYLFEMLWNIFEAAEKGGI